MSAWHYWRVYCRSLGSKLGAAQHVEQRNESTRKKKFSTGMTIYLFLEVPLLEQSKEGGRMVLPAANDGQQRKKIIKHSGKIESRDIIPVTVVFITGEGVEKRK
jgi:protein-L-isoaspartate O-methyltransferase